jgi:hypothetical protein
MVKEFVPAALVFCETVPVEQTTADVEANDSLTPT